MRLTITTALCSLLAWTAAAGQDGGLSFEVAAIRPVQLGLDGASVGIRIQGEQLRVGGYSLRDLMIAAYRVRPYQVVGPDWIGEDRFDVQAKLPAGATANQVPDMLQTLLTERFDLKTHREKRELPAHALIVGKPPLRLTENNSGDPPLPLDALMNVAFTVGTDGMIANLGNGSSYTFSPKGRFEAKKLTMPLLAEILERFSDRAVLDMTGLKSAYDFSIDVGAGNYTPVLLRASANAGVPISPQNRAVVERAGNPLLEAIEQVGLKLDPQRAPIAVIVVDNARRTPTEN
jgi:uncharacterized protein (TIGR03435 family)